MRSENTLMPDFSVVRGRRILIGLSGGADSVALATLLAEAREAYDLTLFALHVDHAIRPESPADADFCRALCERLDIPLHVVRIDVPAMARLRHTGLETEARIQRHAQLKAFMRSLGADCVALAHHMDDQAETVLMRLGRGAGVEGLCGMRELSGSLYRPLLRYRKSALIAHLRQSAMDWREDATNGVDDNPRNAIRLHVIPELEKWYPQCVRAVARCADTAQIESDCLDEIVRGYIDNGGSVGPFCRWLSLDPPPHRAILRRAIRAMCPTDLSWEQVNAVEALCAQPRGKLDIGEACCAERTGRRLYFVPKRLPVIHAAPLSLNGETALPPLGVVTVAPCPPVPIRNDPMRQALSAQAMEGAVLRTRRPGDRIRPLGSGDKLLSDYYIDKKVDRPLRDATPIVAVGNRVHWVVGHGISAEAALKPGDRAVELRFTWNTIPYNGGKHHAE